MSPKLKGEGMSPEAHAKKIAINKGVREIQVSIRSLQKNALKLMAHEDTTPDQLEQAHQMLTDVRKRVQEFNQLALKHNVALTLD